MSSYADLQVGNLSLYSFRNYLQREIISLFFYKQDYIKIDNFIDEPEDEDSNPYTKHSFNTTVLKAKQRLDALGFTLVRFEKNFNERVFDALDYTSFFQRLHIDVDDYEKKTHERIDKNVTFKKWKNSMKKIIQYELENGRLYHFNQTKADNLSITTECDKIIFYSIIDEYNESFYGINPEIINPAFIYRLILENCDDKDEIYLDFSELVDWDSKNLTIAENAFDIVEKTIVLVEGTSDKDILEFSLKMIYPHLYDLFYFMDFEDGNGGKRDPGTSFIIKNLKAFYFSKLKTRFVAVFDNDAEGYQSLCNLEYEVKNWPENYRILLYPEDKLFMSYPTLIPNGEICNDDINKKACSIELYLPDSIIQYNGVYSPIEWEARKKISHSKLDNEFLYQGVISQKDDIKDRFHELRKKIESKQYPFKLNEWERIKNVIDCIVFAFC